jgi:hypothetical protein
MSNNIQKASVSFTELLLVAFIILKLCGVINWSWWWVFSPFWIPASIAIVILIIYIILLPRK